MKWKHVSRQRLELQRERDEQIQFKRLRDVEVKQEEDRFRQQVSEKQNSFIFKIESN